MSKKIDPRIPATVGEGALPAHPSLQTPWGKLIGTQETLHYAARLQAVYGSLFFEAMRILVPDYEKRCQILCDAAYEAGKEPFCAPGAEQSMPFYNIPPFLKGCMLCGVTGDYGDEVLMMDGRVNDVGSYRVEKEIDHCPWDIMGSELGRCTTSKLQGIGDGMNTIQRGPSLDLNMVEAKCCGDLHCRIVAENREKYPLPEHEGHAHADCYGPVVTGEQIRFTLEENLVSDAQYFREDCNYKYTSALVMQVDATTAHNGPGCMITYGMGIDYGQGFFDACMKQNLLKREEIENCLRWVFEAAGKAMFCDTFAIRGLRDWLGVPDDIHDGRMLGGYIEIILQTLKISYEIEAFNKDEVVYLIDRKELAGGYDLFSDALVSMWYGMAKTLVSAMYAAWEEKKDAPDNVLRLKIARKVDKYCS